MIVYHRGEIMDDTDGTVAECQRYGRYIWVKILEGRGKSSLVEDSWKYKIEIQNGYTKWK